jgi:hypothetical protein
MRAVSIMGTDCGPAAKTSLAVTGEISENFTILAPMLELIWANIVKLTITLKSTNSCHKYDSLSVITSVLYRKLGDKCNGGGVWMDR